MTDGVLKIELDSNKKNKIIKCPFKTPQEIDSTSKDYSNLKYILSSKNKENFKDVSDFDYSIQV